MKTIETSEMPNIVYLHGFASGTQSKKGRYLHGKFSGVGAEVFQPELVEGDFRDTTVSAQLEAVDQAVREHEPCLLVGSSLGGYLAALYAFRRPDLVPALVLLAPAFDFVRRWANRLGKEQMEAWKLSGEMPVYHYGRDEPASIGYGFFEEALRDCHRTSDSIYRYLRQDLVVPFSMEGIAFNVECGDLFIGDLEAGRVEV